MKTIVQRYLGANFILPFLTSTLFFVFFLLTFQLLRITKLVINKGLSFSSVLVLIGHISISFLPMAIPLSALFASIYALNKMSADSEFLSMRSFGFSKLKLFTPFLYLGLLIAMVIFALNHSLIPNSQREFRRNVTLLTSKGVLTEIKAGQFFTDIPQVTIFAEEVRNQGELLSRVFIHFRGNNPQDDKVIYAKEGHLEKKKNEALGRTSLRLKLLEGNIVKNFSRNYGAMKNPGLSAEKILFAEYEFPVASEDIKNGFVTKDSMKSTPELYDLVKSPPPMDRKDFIKVQLEFWSRINTPFLCIVFILLGFSLGVQRGRGKNQNSATLCFMALIIYYAIFFTGVSLARNDVIPSWIAVFIPTFLTLILGMKFFSRLEWVA